MEILDQISTKVKKALQKIEDLQLRIVELEETNALYEAKLKEIMQQMDVLEEEPTAPSTESTSSYSSEVTADGGQDAYRQSY
jgi:FtsZ-binding cell division protein ZapB